VLPFDRGIPQASSKSQVHRGQIGGMADYYGFDSSVYMLTKAIRAD